MFRPAFALHEDHLIPKVFFALLLSQFLNACTFIPEEIPDSASTVMISAAEGGEVASPDGQLTLSIPAGALGRDTEISIAPVSEGELPEELRALAEEYGEIEGPGYLLLPGGLEFEQPVTISIELKADELTSEDGFLAPLLLIQGKETDPEFLEDIEIQVSLDGGAFTIRGKLDHFSWVVATRSLLEINLLQVEPKQKQVDDIFDISAKLKNTSTNAIEYIDLKASIFVSGPLRFFGYADSVSTLPVRVASVLKPRASEEDTYTLSCVRTGIASYTVRGTALERDISQLNATKKPIRFTVSAVVECVGPTATPSPTISPSPTITPTPSTTPTPSNTPTETPVTGFGVVKVANAFGRYGPSQAFLNEFEFTQGQVLELLGNYGGWLFVQAEGFPAPAWIWNGSVDTDININALPFVNYDAILPFTQFAPPATGITSERNNDGTITLCWKKPNIEPDDLRPSVVELNLILDGVQRKIFVADTDLNNCITFDADPGTLVDGVIRIGHQRGYSQPVSFDHP